MANYQYAIRYDYEGRSVLMPIMAYGEDEAKALADRYANASINVNYEVVRREVVGEWEVYSPNN